MVFRGKFSDGLSSAFENGRLRFSAQTQPRSNAQAFSRLIAQLHRTEWVVYLKASFGGPEATLDYLGRYTHRIAISNSRLLKLENGRVHFRYRDRRDNDKLKELDLSAEEFTRRFLQHVLPKGFKRLRNFGILANGCKRACLARCRQLLQASPPLKPEKKTVQEWMLKLTGVDVTVCRYCHAGHMLFMRELPPQRPARSCRDDHLPHNTLGPLPSNAGDTS
jgi:hypothetical protein